MRVGSSVGKFTSALLGLALQAAMGSCAANGHPDAQADAPFDAGDMGLEETGDAPVSPDSGDPPPATCQQIRRCVAAGGGVDACLARGAPEAQGVFMALLDCLGMPCPGLVAACVCREACQQPDGYCLDQADACMTASGETIDSACDQYCGG